MNKERFLELVNLHIDHEISADESAELQGAIKANAEYRKIFEQYLRIHKATVVLFEASREGAPATPQLSRPRREVHAGRRESSWWLPLGTVGTLAAAAFAIVVTQQNEPKGKELTGAPVASATAPVSTPSVASAPVLEQPKATESTLTAFSFNQKPESLAIHQQVKFRPINKVQNQSFVFSPEWRKLEDQGAEPLKLTPVNNTQAEEMTALQFKR